MSFRHLIARVLRKLWGGLGCGMVMLIACPLFFCFSCCEMTDREMVGKGDDDTVRLVVAAATNGDFFVKESERQVLLLLLLLMLWWV